MGVNADFQANFGSFLSALQEADTALADFGKGADKVGTQLQTMTDKWAGVKVIQQANELVTVVNNLGGATTLTTTEQAKLNAQLTEAIAKYQAIGQDVPPEMQKLADQTKQASTATTDWVGTLTTLAGAFGIAFSVDAVVSFVDNLFKGAQALQILSAQTQISTDDLQLLTAATASYGVTGDELGRALFALQKRINGGDESVVSAYAKMGIALKDVKDQNATELFLMTERALGQLQGGIRDAAAADLYGGKLGASMAAFSTGVDKAVDDADRLNVKVSKDSVKAMADYGDAIDRAKRSAESLATVVVGQAAQGIDATNKALDAGVSKWRLLIAAIEDWKASAGGTIFINATNALTAQTVALNANTDATGTNAKIHGDIILPLSEEAKARSAVTFMTTMQANAVEPLTALQKTQLDQLNAMGQLNAKNAEGIFVTVTQLNLYKKGLEDAKKATEDLAKQQAQADAVAMDQYTKRIKQLESITQANLKAYSFDGQIAQLNLLIAAEEATAKAVYDQLTSEKDRMKVIEDLAVKRTTIANQMMALEQKHASVVNDAVIAELQAQAQLEAAYGRNVDGTIKVEDAQTKLQIALDQLHAKKQAGIDQYAQEQVLMQQFLKDQDAETAALTAGTDAITKKTAATKADTQAQADARNSFSLAGGSAVPDKFAGWTSAQLQSAGYIDAYNQVTPLGESQGLGFSGGGGRLGMAARAGGGPVTAGTPYLVGEKGPELFVPSQSGAISPNGAGGTVVHNTFNIVDTESNIAQRVAAHITRSVMRSTRLS